MLRVGHGREGKVHGMRRASKFFFVFYTLLATQFSLRRRRIRRRQRRRYVTVSVTALTALFVCPFRFTIFTSCRKASSTRKIKPQTSNLIKKTNPWRWTDKKEACFQELKRKISSTNFPGGAPP